MHNSNKNIEFGTLYVVATPIGNINDISFRAVEILSKVTLIATEDTRHSKKLLNAYGIKTRQVSYHKFNELERCDYLIKLLKKGDDIAIISDAGTPCISDPGDVIISQAHKENICITPIPGASSVISAICASGYAANGFKFIGFLPKKISQKKEILKNSTKNDCALIFFESPNRVISTLTELRNIYNNNKELCIAKEISKIYEDIKIKKIDDWLNYFEKDNKEKLKGEFVFVIPASENNNEDYSENEIEEFIKFLIDYKISYSTALKIVCKRFKINKNDIYKKYIHLANK